MSSTTVYLIIGFAFALIIGVDAANRLVLPRAVLYMIGSAILWPVVTPLWFGRRPLRAGERRKGGAFWVWVKGFVAIWTVGMAVLTTWALTSAASATEATTTAQGVGSAIGLGIGGGVFCGVWAVPAFLLLFLGLLLRNDNIEEGPTGPLAEYATQASE